MLPRVRFTLTGADGAFVSMRSPALIPSGEKRCGLVELPAAKREFRSNVAMTRLAARSRQAALVFTLALASIVTPVTNAGATEPLTARRQRPAPPAPPAQPAQPVSVGSLPGSVPRAYAVALCAAECIDGRGHLDGEQIAYVTRTHPSTAGEFVFPAVDAASYAVAVQVTMPDDTTQVGYLRLRDQGDYALAHDFDAADQFAVVADVDLGALPVRGLDRRPPREDRVFRFLTKRHVGSYSRCESEKVSVRPRDGRQRVELQVRVGTRWRWTVRQLTTRSGVFASPTAPTRSDTSTRTRRVRGTPDAKGYTWYRVVMPATPLVRAGYCGSWGSRFF